MKSFDFSRKGQTSEVDIFVFVFLKYVLEICFNNLLYLLLAIVLFIEILQTVGSVKCYFMPYPLWLDVMKALRTTRDQCGLGKKRALSQLND